MISLLDGFPSLTAKAYNSRVLVMFLLQCLTSLSGMVATLEVRLATTSASAMCVLLDRMERLDRLAMQRMPLCMAMASWRL